MIVRTMKNHYYKTKVVKMGKWALRALDSEVWHTLATSNYFRKYFGIGKGLLTIQTPDYYQHEYVPVEYHRKLHQRINEINSKDYKGLEIILKKFYLLKHKSREAISKYANHNFSKYTNIQLAKVFQVIRDRIHEVAVFDQFPWQAEEYWTLKIKNILNRKLGLKVGSKEYNQALFILTKPENISTTAAEKLMVTQAALKIFRKKSTIVKESNYLAKKFGWLPIFVYGRPWQAGHYADEIRGLLGKDDKFLRSEISRLKKYFQDRKKDINEVAEKYDIDRKDLQLFIDFGLATDVRSEAEYFVSYAGRFLMPIFKEIAKRLYITENQLRLLFEKDIISALTQDFDVTHALERKKSYIAWGFNKKMDTRLDFNPKESEKLYNYLERKVKNVQENLGGRGLCASPGKARGKIRIVPKPEKNNKVKNGDILVTFSTTTDYLPAMKRASAIITEVGGQTCHAAVVSREFGIPCLVAVTDAMKIYKDGELVEVDADSGVVRKLCVDT